MAAELQRLGLAAGARIGILDRFEIGIMGEAEDTAVATLKFRSGALGIIEATTAVRPTDLEGSLSILGEKGSVEIAGFAVNNPKLEIAAASSSESLSLRKGSLFASWAWQT